MFLQMPFLIILYDTIRGLTNTVTANGQIRAEPRYIPKPSDVHSTSIPLVDKLYHSLVATPGKMEALGMNLANKPFGHGMTAAQRIPFFIFVGVAVTLQFIQMRRMNSRNPQAQANKQMQTIQKITPILFAYIYFLVPAAVVIYMIVSTLIRIVTQEVMFGTGMVQLPGTERQIGGARAKPALATASGLVESGGDGEPEAKAPPKAPPKATGNGSRPPASRNGQGGAANGKGVTEGSTAKPSHSRARGKRPRKAR